MEVKYGTREAHRSGLETGKLGALQGRFRIMNGAKETLAPGQSGVGTGLAPPWHCIGTARSGGVAPVTSANALVRSGPLKRQDSTSAAKEWKSNGPAAPFASDATRHGRAFFFACPASTGHAGWPGGP